MSYVVMFGYGKGLGHCLCDHVWFRVWVGLRFGLALFKRTNINKMKIKNWLFGYGDLGSH
jgi:hypothetical protein